MTAIIAARNLEAGYGHVEVLRGINLHVEPGEIVALLGANGAGKTTTLLALAGELPATSGVVEWHGNPTRAPLHRRAKSGLAFVLEERAVMGTLSVRDNLRLGRGSVERALKLAPELEPLLNRRGGLLSGGEQQILTLARALAAEPELLLVDELSLGLAPLIVERLLDAIQSAAQAGMAVLLVEQQARNALKRSSRAYIMARGQVVLEGQSPDLLRKLPEIESLYLAGVA